MRGRCAFCRNIWSRCRTSAGSGFATPIVFFGSARIREDGPLGEYYHDARALAAMLTDVGEDVPRTHLPLRGLLRRRPGHHGSGQSRRGGCQRQNHRTEHRPAVRAVSESVHHAANSTSNSITSSCASSGSRIWRRRWWCFPGGFGTHGRDCSRSSRWSQTQKLAKKITIILYGSSFWKEIVNFDALVKYGTISAPDLELFHFADSPEAALADPAGALTEQAARCRKPRFRRFRTA